MTTNAIVALHGENNLTEIEQMILAEMQEDVGAFKPSLARIKIAPGGIGQFLMGDETVKSFTGIVALSQIIRGYWPGSGTGDAPLCSSPNGLQGIFAEPTDKQFGEATKARRPHPGIIALSEQRPLPDAFDCATCPLNEWGSEHQRRGGKGKGKACKEMRRLLVIPDGWALPAIMSLPPTSIGIWDDFCSAQASKKNAYFAARVKFSLDTREANGGEKYNVVNISPEGKITDKDKLLLVSAIRREFREFISTSPVENNEYEVVDAGSATVEASAAPDDDRLPPF